MVDNSWTQVGLPSSSFSLGSNGNSYDWSTFANAGKYASDALLGTNFIGNDTNAAIAKENLEWQKDYAKLNEQLLRESWSREDNAVQRRVADLKAAGLSPTLAAGSAAATSGPIQLHAPQNEFRYENPFGGGVIDAMGKVMSLKYADLQNQYLQKQIDHYGEPAWFKALQSVLEKFGDKGFMNTIINNSVNGVENALDAAGIEHGKVDFTPKYGFTFAKPPEPTKAANNAIVQSARGFGARFDDSSMNLEFPSSKAARDWYLSLGGTSFEWYYGVAKYGTPAKFIAHIIRDGFITRDGDVYLDR